MSSPFKRNSVISMRSMSPNIKSPKPPKSPNIKSPKSSDKAFPSLGKEKDKEEDEEDMLVGLGGRRELERLMTLYKVKIPLPKRQEETVNFESLDDEEEPMDDHERELQATIKKRLVNVSKIERIVMKSSYERRPEEVEVVRKELSKMEVFRKIDVSPAAELDICRFANFRKFKAGEYVVRQGDIGDAFYIILEGMCKVEHNVMGAINQLFASDTFGELALIQEGSTRKASVVAEQPCKMLEVKKPEFNRYIKPFHLTEQIKKEYLVRQLREGGFNHFLMFMVAGHVSVTKKCATVRVSNIKSTLLPNPLDKPTKKQGNVGAGGETADDEEGSEDVNVDLRILYKGAVLDPDAVLARQKSNYTVTAMSQVEILAIDTLTHIFVDNPVIDQDTLLAIKRRNSFVPDKTQLAKIAREQVLWKLYCNHLSSHVIYKHRKDQVIKAGPFSKRREIQKDDLAAVNLDNLPELEHKRITDKIEPTDGRWPFMQPNIYRSPLVHKLQALTPMYIMLKDKTIF